jgi:hypothetical protein
MKKAIAAAIRVDEVAKIRDQARQLHAAAKVAKDPGPLADLTEIKRLACRGPPDIDPRTGPASTRVVTRGIPSPG